ncbi:hypothetical protein QZH41_011715 [Actinostola sp. cb2023]|nr:hypothetical protein QZH41_011715 [Actinostola sp. cb2023]
MAGRGRGRGRGTSSSENRPGPTSNGIPSPKTQSEESKEPIAPSPVDLFDDLCGDFRSLKLTSSSDLITDLSKRAKVLTTSDDQYLQVIDILYQKVFGENEFATKIAGLGNELSSLDEVGGKFRSFLLKRVQEHYKNRENLKKNSASEWTGLLCLICEIFKVLRIRGSPLKPLTGPIYEMFGELLLNQDDCEQIECFHRQFRNVGKMLLDFDKVKMEELACKIRDSILSEKSNAETRCLLTELLELQASSWSLNPEVERFYSDAMADILASQS